MEGFKNITLISISSRLNLKRNDRRFAIGRNFRQHIYSRISEITRSSDLELVDLLPVCCRISLIISLNGCSAIKRDTSLYLREHNSIHTKIKTPPNTKYQDELVCSYVIINAYNYVIIQYIKGGHICERQLI